MTRYTNVGYKRKYLQAGFEDNGYTNRTLLHNSIGSGLAGKTSESTAEIPSPSGNDHNESQTPSKRRRIRKAKAIKKSKSGQLETQVSSGKENGDNDSEGAVGINKEGKEKKVAGQSLSEKQEKGKRKKGKMKEKLLKKKHQMKQLSSERRRLQRIRERNINTICFACRKKGHAAIDCPSSNDVALEGEEIDRNDSDKKPVPGTVGFCYRCGSRTHTLSRCKKREDPSNPLPFATCFVCSSKGHLASSCPNNAGRGVYPNGGSCKICGDTSHLAKNCSLRKEASVGNSVLGIGNTHNFPGSAGVEDELGADEDDFHILKRRQADVEKEERDESRIRRLANVKRGALTGVVKAFPKSGLGPVSAAPVNANKKIVNF